VKGMAPQGVSYPVYMKMEIDPHRAFTFSKKEKYLQFDTSAKYIYMNENQKDRKRLKTQSRNYVDLD
jgi:hypothetical protein